MPSDLSNTETNSSDESKGTQGFEVFTPDLRHASNAARVEAHNALMQLLSATSDLKQIQFRWKVDSDYSEALLRYQQETEKADNVWSKTCRNERFYRYMDRMRRRERLRKAAGKPFR